ncbi:MAG: hypothetical protein RLZZ214_4305 [Verrucomicrobiota bacterium]|jgi:endonuclease/exonuclease/phosphatase family metal-dependent hydrolase
MRIATWNIERPDPADTARNRARMEKIREIDADLWILTETHEVIDLSNTHHGAATTFSARKPLPGEACATVWSRWPIQHSIDTSDPSEAVCVEVAHPDGPLLVYGSIIAYAGYRGPDGMSRMWHEHYRFIEWHGRDWKRLRAEFPGHRFITGGDYNQNRDGARWYGTRKGRELLTRALSDVGLKCVTEEDFVRAGKLQNRHTVDHLCLDEALATRVIGVDVWERTRADGMRLSDHSGILVDIAENSPS